MEFNVGDKVKFLNDTGGGTVTKIIDKKNVMVLNEYDFEVPVKNNELLLIESAAVKTIDDEYLKHKEEEVFKEVKEIEEEPVVHTYIDELGNDVQLYLAFFKPEKDDEYQVYLINDSNYDLHFTFSLKEESEWDLQNTEILEANTKMQLVNIDRESINKKQELLLQGVLFSSRLFERKEPLSTTILLDPIQFFNENNWKENDFFDDAVYLINIYSSVKLKEVVESMEETEFEKVKDDKEAGKVVIKESKKKKEIEEVDLHLQEVIDDPAGLSKSDMLEIQLKKFREKLEEAIKARKKKIVFIHGLGNGKLKTEIRREIDTHYKNCKYQDASFQQYGFGATLVLIY